MKMDLKVLEPEMNRQIQKLRNIDFTKRFILRDTTLWPGDQAAQQEITHRLAWLDASIQAEAIVKDAEELLWELLQEGYSHAVVLGMGGSSLAPEVYSEFKRYCKDEINLGLSLSILDSTSPQQILEKRAQIPLDKTLFIISSKSGSTVEVNTLLSYFWALMEELDPTHPGKHFIAITDPETQMQKIAIEKGFRKIFLANPDVGGRYSALIAFGLVPAVLVGINGQDLIKEALKYSLRPMDPADNLGMGQPGFQLGLILAAILGAAYLTGRDKLTILADKPTQSLGSWIEQLVAESSGKSSEGILPIDLEPLLLPEKYSQDRLFVYLRRDGSLDAHVQKLIQENHPAVTFQFEHIYDLAGFFYRWELATAIACAMIGVNAFNQPNVQESKDIAKKVIARLKTGQKLENEQAIWRNEKYQIFSTCLKNTTHASIREYLDEFLALQKTGDFISINAFLPRNPANQEKLQELRKAISEKTALPTTLGFGPRFLHSTGQLHKGGKNNGLFIVLSQDEKIQLPIPDEGIGFGDLILAQAVGDTQALESHQRRVIRLHFAHGAFETTDLGKLFSSISA
jgi:transaldolase/glucose-6-phosphate isomerase